MRLRAGVSRQQYQRLESKEALGWIPLTLIAKGLNSELVLIPKEKLTAVYAVLKNEGSEPLLNSSGQAEGKEQKSLADNPWQGLLGDDHKHEQSR